VSEKQPVRDSSTLGYIALQIADRGLCEGSMRALQAWKPMKSEKSVIND